MNRILRAKIKIGTVSASLDTYGPNPDKKTGEAIHGSAVYSEDKTTENYAFSVATPSLTLQMFINNPDAFDKLIDGKEYYLDFVPCEAEDSTGLGVDYGSRL